MSQARTGASSHRLALSRADFSHVTADVKARRAASTYFSAVGSRTGVGCAVVVSKKVAKSAVGRHLLKRRVREALGPWYSNSYALIVYARPGSASLPYAEITAELNALLPRVAP